MLIAILPPEVLMKKGRKKMLEFAGNRLEPLLQLMTGENCKTAEFEGVF